MNTQSTIRAILIATLLFTPSLLANKVHDYVLESDFDSLLHFLRACGPAKAKELVNEPNEDGAYPLHLAGMTGNVDIAKILLLAGAHWYANWKGQTAMNTAFQYGHVEVSDVISNLLIHGRM